MSDLQLQFAAYAPDGDRLGLLPYPLSAQASDVMNDLGSGRLDYLAAAPQAKFLENLCEVAVEVWDGTAWVEPGARLLRLRRSASVIEETRTRRYTLPSYGAMLRKVRMFVEEALNENGERQFDDITVGEYVKTLIDESKARGNIPGLEYNFTASVDSAGTPWDGQMPARSVRYGEDLLTGLGALADEGLADWQMVGRELKLFVLDGLGQTRDVQLVHGRDITEAPDDEDATELAGRIGVIGDGGRVYEAIAPSVGPWGLWEELVTAGGVRDIGALQLIGQVEQERRSQVRKQMTRQLRVAGVQYLPQVHYLVGDKITAPDETGAAAELRVRQITLTHGAEGVGANLVLNDRFVEHDLRQQRIVRGLMGTSSSTGGNGGIPSTDDTRKPKAPTGFSLAGAGLWNTDGTAMSILSGSWSDVTEATDETSITIGGYLVQIRVDEDVTFHDLTTVLDNEFSWSPFSPGQVVHGRVAAISSKGVQSDFSEVESVTMPNPTFALDAPTPPIVTVSDGVVEVSWDGFLATDPPTEAGASHLQTNIEMGVASNGEFSLVGTLVEGQQRQSFIGLGIGALWWFRLVAVDRLGRPSDPSTAVSIVVTGIDGENLLVDSVTGNVIRSGAVETRHLAASVGQELDITSNESVNIIVGRIETVEDDLEGTQGELADMRQNYRFGEDGLDIGRADSPIQFHVDNEGAEIRSAGDRVSWWDAGEFFSQSIVAKQQLQVGPLSIEGDGSGGAVFRLAGS